MQFGLIAEDVAEIFPELVVYSSDGKPETVSYHVLATLLLNEFQKERLVTHQQAAALEKQSEELAQLKNQVAQMAKILERLQHATMVATSK